MGVKCGFCANWRSSEARGAESMLGMGYGVCAVAKTVEQRATFLAARRVSECGLFKPADRDEVLARAGAIRAAGAEREARYQGVV